MNQATTNFPITLLQEFMWIELYNIYFETDLKKHIPFVHFSRIK